MVLQVYHLKPYVQQAAINPYPVQPRTTRKAYPGKPIRSYKKVRKSTKDVIIWTFLLLAC